MFLMYFTEFLQQQRLLWFGRWEKLKLLWVKNSDYKKNSRIEASPFNSVSGQVLPQNLSLDLLNKLLCYLFQQLRSCWYVYWLRGIRVRLKRVSVKSAWEASFRICFLTRHSLTSAGLVSGVCSVRTRVGVMATFQVDPSGWIRLWQTWKRATVVPTFRKVSSRFWPDE